MTKILFICEHGSAKSVIAASHFERMARELGVEAHASSRGTDPDAGYPSHVIAGLEADGLEPLDDAPVALSQSDIASAAKIVAFCSPKLLPLNAIPSAVWDDVPPVSEGYGAARDEIVRRLKHLLK